MIWTDPVLRSRMGGKNIPLFFTDLKSIVLNFMLFNSRLVCNRVDDRDRAASNSTKI